MARAGNPRFADRLVIDELDLPAHGYRVTPADPNLWCPFPDGTSFAQFLDDRDTEAHMRESGFSVRESHTITPEPVAVVIAAWPNCTGWRCGNSPARAWQRGASTASPAAACQFSMRVRRTVLTSVTKISGLTLGSSTDSQPRGASSSNSGWPPRS